MHGSAALTQNLANNRCVLSVGLVACCRGKISCKRLWQIGMEHGAEDDYYEDDESEADVNIGAPKSICNWLKGPGEGAAMGNSGTGLWVNVFDSGPNPGKVSCSSRCSSL